MSSPGSWTRLGWNIRPRRLLLPVVLVSALVVLGAVACEDDASGGDVDGEGASTAVIDRAVVLGQLSQVRDLFADRSPLDGDVIGDVSYEDGVLDVTLAQDSASTATADRSGQAEQICNDLGDAIQLADLQINVLGPDGDELASCQFGQ